MRHGVMLGVVVVAGFAQLACGDVWYVDKNASGSVKSGTSWATAYTTIQEGIDAAYADGGGDVWVAGGVYDEARSGPTGSLAMRNGVNLYGGFEGTEVNRWQRIPGAYVSEIDGSTAAPGGTAAWHTVLADFSGFTLDGFMVTGGAAVGAWDSLNARGGGLIIVGNKNGAVTLPPSIVSNCIFTENTATRGAGIYSEGANVVIRDCAFLGNDIQAVDLTPRQGYRCGGGVHNMYGTLIIERCRFDDNTALYGGGVYNIHSPNAALVNCVFAGNSAIEVGGGFCNDNGSTEVTVTNCTFWNNTAIDGGAVCGINATSTSVLNCIVWNNSSDQIDLVSPEVDYCDIEDRAPVDHNIQMDPLFSDAANGNFRLEGTSPCVDSGTLNNAPLNDIRGVGRPQILGVDMGAYEMQAETMASRCGGTCPCATAKEARGDAIVFAILLTVCWIGTRATRRKV